MIMKDGVFPCAHHAEQEFFVRTIEASEQGKSTIIFLHDLFDYHACYESFAESVAKLGHKVILPDLRGFGRSPGPRGQIDRHEDLVDDIENLIKSIPGRVILGGHGFGGLIAIRLLHRQSLPPEKSLLGLILSNPLLRFAQALPKAGRFVFDRLSHPFDLVALPWKLGASERCSSSEAAAAITEDPLAREQLLLRSYREVERLMKLEQNASYLIDVPTLTLLSGSDTIGSIAHARLFTKAIDPDLSQVITYSQSRHDLFSDIEREQVYKDVSQWLEKSF